MKTKLFDKSEMNEKFKLMFKELSAEFFGTFMLMLIGCSANASFTLNPNNKEKLQTDIFGISFSWGIAVFVGVSASIAISGGHLNPAVSIAFATISRFPWTKVIPYILAQFFGAFFGSATTYLLYRDAILTQHQLFPLSNQTDLRAYGHPLSTGGIFATYPASHLSLEGVLIDQIIATCSLLICVMIVTDSKNLNVPQILQPLLLAFVIETHVAVFSFNCGAALNPARDLAPRIFTAIAGWGHFVFRPLNGNYWWSGGVVGPIIGGILGIWIYYIFIEYFYPKKSDEQENRQDIALK